MQYLKPQSSPAGPAAASSVAVSLSLLESPLAERDVYLGRAAPDSRFGRVPALLAGAKSLFRQPFAWALIAASVVADLLFFGSDHDAISGSLLFGQMYVTGGWLVLGQGPRLLRGALFVAATVGVAWLQQLTYPPVTGPSGEIVEGITVDIFGLVLAINICLAGGAAICTLAWVVALRWWGRRRGAAADRAARRFSLGEILGWTTIVAVASAFLRLADAEAVGAEALAPVAIHCLTAALLMALFARQEARCGAANVVVAALAVAALFGALPLLYAEVDLGGVAMTAGSFTYVVLWIVAQRLDFRWARGHAASR